DKHKIIDQVEVAKNLNEQQRIAYRIITQHFISRFILKHESEKPLKMLMTGPGDTGKTYVVNALKSVMEAYNCGHTIRFLAPTDSAAALIDGMTLHKGLGLRIENATKGKGNRNLEKLRLEWKHVDILFLDEASLLSAQLLCEIDYAL
ncbi:hypothetical protein FA15DRAFT_555740, partial [Coprinopsis marcescibilis]